MDARKHPIERSPSEELCPPPHPTPQCSDGGGLASGKEEGASMASESYIPGNTVPLEF